MKIEKIELSKLKQHPKNPRRGDVASICESIKENGQFRPLIVSRETMHILAGNHTKQAMENVGFEKADVVFLDKLTPEQEIKILLADNKSSDGSIYDNDVLLELLNSLETLDGTLFSEEDKAKIQKLSDDALSQSDFKATIKGATEILKSEYDKATTVKSFKKDEITDVIKFLEYCGSADVDFDKNEIVITLDKSQFGKLVQGA